jgi:hypothetical protein
MSTNPLSETCQPVGNWHTARTVTATDRREDEPCECGTPGCSVNHTASDPDASCETW